MDTRYSRNRIYLNQDEQEILRKCPLLLGGSGIGSVIAECALRLGFEDMTIIDGDKVELTNLNRQNYTQADIATSKSEAIRKRLESINPDAKIKVYDYMVSEENILDIIQGKAIAVNALDFTTNIPLIFDSVCQESNIPVLHPYNLGWGALTTVISPNGLNLQHLQHHDEPLNELNIVEYFSSYLKFWGTPHSWLDEVIIKYKQEGTKISPPQLSIASYSVAAMCTHILYNIATNKEVKVFPEFYFSTIM